MDRKTKELLQQYYEAPAPERKRGFVREHRSERMNTTQVLQTQFHYISRKSWILSALFFVVLVALHDVLNSVWMGSVYALVPFLVMISFTECMRSYQYGMEELELSARFPLKSIVLSRLLILGGVDMLVLVVAAAVTGREFWVELVYMLVPFLITSWGGFMIVRRFAGKDGGFYCFGFSAIISVLQCVVASQYPVAFEARYFWGWILIALVFLALLTRESVRTIRMTEELAWN